MKLMIGMAIASLSLAASLSRAQSGAQAQDVKLTLLEQRTVDAQLATPKLDPSATVTGLDLTATPLRDIVAAIAKAGGITVRYHSTVSNLDAPSAVKLSSATVEDALHSVLDPKVLTFKVTGAKSVFIYPSTPGTSEKFIESVRTFAIVNADVAALTTILNRTLTVTAGDLRPVLVSLSASRMIIVRATTEQMARIAKVIADNDKR